MAWREKNGPANFKKPSSEQKMEGSRVLMSRDDSSDIIVLVLFYYPFGRRQLFFPPPTGNIEALSKIPETFAVLLLLQTFGNIKMLF